MITRLRQIMTRQASTTRSSDYSEGIREQARTEGENRSSTSRGQKAETPDIPDLELLRCIGHGSYGEVWLARNILGSYRAVKIIERKAFRDEEAFEREFLGLQRFEPISREHDGFVAILHVGRNRADGFFYYVMELADDDSNGNEIDADKYVPKTLSSELARSGRLPVKEAVQLGSSLSDALAELHRRGLVHRDIKPSNIIFVKGHAKLADIGLVAQAGEKSRFGTEGYIPPEGPGTPQADLYSLGKLLYEASTGTDRLSYPDLPSDLDTMPERETFLKLNSIILKTCDNDTGTRYRRATEISGDLAQLVEKPAKMVRNQLWHIPTLAFSAVLLAGLAAAVSVTVWKHAVFRPRPAKSIAVVPFERNPTGNPTPEKSIAVLPFENLSDDKEHTFFADGVQDDVLTKLAKVADLKVISRTSVMQYRGKQDLRMVGRALGVSHVLAGTVRRSDGQVHINAQLLDTRTDAHVWAEEYHRDLNEVFAIEAEVAQSIVTQLQATLSPREKNAIERPTTSDMTAFDLYTRARNLLLTRSLGGNAKAIFLQIADLLNQAVARDRSFFQAYCQLAQAHDSLYFFGFDHTSDRLALAEAAIQAASRLHPDAGETHLARAENLYEGHLDYDGALSELGLAGPSLPNDPRVFALKAYIERRQGRWEESIHSLERAVDLDPRNVPVLQQAALTYLALRRYAQETSLLHRVLTIEPNDVETKIARASVEFYWKANTRPLHQTIDSIRGSSPDAVSKIADYWLSCALAERDIAAATNAVKAFGETPSFDYAVMLNHPLLEGVLARMTGDDEKARAAFAVARAEQEKAVQAQPNHGPALCVLGLIDAGLGRKDEALREGWRAVELVPAEKDPINAAFMIKYLAMTAAWVGEKDLACDQLETALGRPSFLSYGELKLLPWWDPLRGDPRFEKIVASLAPK
jgi:TolB-like protein/tetratricopeptide (TPR) repeat protein